MFVKSRTMGLIKGKNKSKKLFDEVNLLLNILVIKIMKNVKRLDDKKNLWN